MFSKFFEILVLLLSILLYDGSRLIKTATATYKYDSEGFLIEKNENDKIWQYLWTAGGMLKEVQRPDGSVVSFKYDAFGRRMEKKYQKQSPASSGMAMYLCTNGKSLIIKKQLITTALLGFFKILCLLRSCKETSCRSVFKVNILIRRAN